MTYMQLEPVQLTLFLICAYVLAFKYTPAIYNMLKASLTAMYDMYEYDYDTKRITDTERITAWDVNTGDEIEVEEYDSLALIKRGEETRV